MWLKTWQGDQSQISLKNFSKFCQVLFKNDEVLADQELNLLSTNPAHQDQPLDFCKGLG